MKDNYYQIEIKKRTKRLDLEEYLGALTTALLLQGKVPRNIMVTRFQEVLELLTDN